MRAVVLDKHGLRFNPDYDPPSAAESEIPVHVKLAGICDTDLQLVKGYMGFRGVLGHEFVGVAQAGRFASQRVVGEINCSCSQCEYCQRGLGNHCPHRTVIGILNHDGAFADIVYVPEVNLHAVPTCIPDEHAVLTEPLAAAFQIPRQIDLGPHRRTAVIGDGRMAYLIAQVLRLQGCQVTVVGKHLGKLEHFATQGFSIHRLGQQGAAREFSLAVDCTGSITGIPTALQFLSPGGTLVLKTTISDQQGPALAQLVIDEITVIGSRCGPFDVALQALSGGRIEVESLITARFPIASAATAFRAAASPQHRKVLLEIQP